MRKLLLLTFILLQTLYTAAQKQKSRTTLDAEKKRNLQQISQVKKILNETQREKQSTLGQIKALNQQI